MSDSDDLLRIALVVLGVLLLAPLLLMGVMMPMMGYWYTGGAMGPGTMGPGTMGSGGGLWWVGTALVPLLVLVVGGYVLYRLLSGREDGEDPARRELRMAYARGDLSEEEFEERRQRLGE